MSKVWLVTGSASGLGRDIAEAVLASGARLLATTRDAAGLSALDQCSLQSSPEKPPMENKSRIRP